MCMEGVRGAGWAARPLSRGFTAARSRAAVTGARLRVHAQGMHMPGLLSDTLTGVALIGSEVCGTVPGRISKSVNLGKFAAPCRANLWPCRRLGGLVSTVCRCLVTASG